MSAPVTTLAARVRAVTDGIEVLRLDLRAEASRMPDPTGARRDVDALCDAAAQSIVRAVTVAGCHPMSPKVKR